MDKNKQIEVTPINKVKVVTDMIIKSNYILIQVKEDVKSTLLIPGTFSMGNSSRLEIIKVGSNVKDFEVGDIIIDLNMSTVNYLEKGDDKYIYCDAYNVLLAIKKDNYILEESKIKDLSKK